jgi:hypothetical protein
MGHERLKIYIYVPRPLHVHDRCMEWKSQPTRGAHSGSRPDCSVNSPDINLRDMWLLERVPCPWLRIIAITAIATVKETSLHFFSRSGVNELLPLGIVQTASSPRVLRGQPHNQTCSAICCLPTRRTFKNSSSLRKFTMNRWAILMGTERPMGAYVDSDDDDNVNL